MFYLIPLGLLRNHHRMDVGGPQPHRLVPLLMRRDAIAKVVGLAYVQSYPLTLTIKASEYIDPGNFVPVCIMVAYLKRVSTPAYGIHNLYEYRSFSLTAGRSCANYAPVLWNCALEHSPPRRSPRPELFCVIGHGKSKWSLAVCFCERPFFKTVLAESKNKKPVQSSKPVGGCCPSQAQRTERANKEPIVQNPIGFEPGPYTQDVGPL